MGCPGSFIYQKINPQNITLTWVAENNEYEDNIEECVEEDNVNLQALTRKLLNSAGVKRKEHDPLINMSYTVVPEEGGKYLDKRFEPTEIRMLKSGKSDTKNLKEHPKNVRLKDGQVMSISERFVGYFRLEDGLLWCYNQEELSSQKGLVVELLKKAGEKLMKGEGVVSISLPVRIFEERSALERCGDLWSTGTKYLTLAAQVSDPLERFKFVM